MPRQPDATKRLARVATPLSLVASLAGCAWTGAGPDGSTRILPGPSSSTQPPSPAHAGPSAPGALPAGARPAAQTATRRPRLALALGGGAARGFAHVGVIEVLERAGIRPDLVVGTSAGSLVGALYCGGLDPTALRQAAMSLEEGTLGDWSLTVRGVLRGRALQDTVNRLVGGRTIERFRVPFAAVTTDLYNGELRLLRQGDAGLAVRASSAVPGVFEPVSIGGREYVDGGVVSPVPVRVARSLGAELVVAVDISAKPKFQETDSLVRVLLQTFAIMSQRLASAELREADVVVVPAIGDLSSADFGNRTLAMAEGARAMQEALPRLKELISAPRSP